MAMLYHLPSRSVTDGICSSFPTLPAPLGQGQAPGQAPGQGQAQSQQGGTQFMSGQPTPGYAELPRNYTSQQPLPREYNGTWQHLNLNVPHPASVMAPSQRPVSSQIPKERGVDEYFAYRYKSGEEVPPQVEEHTVPVLLCHTCSECGQMRSAGYHRNHPVIPGKPIITTPCRKCKKQAKSSHRSRATSYTRVRTCTADEPCDWPREPVHVDISHSERRGRRRDRDDIYTFWRTDHLRQPVIKESSSRANIGLRAVQRSPPRGYRSTTRVRVSSLSPGRSRYDGVWPPPDVVGLGSLRSKEPYHASDEVWPPPDVVRTHSYRKQSPPRPSPRIVELSPSPPPPRARATKVRYREMSEERRVRSPVRRNDSRIRMQSHPRPYRTVIPDHRVPPRSDGTSTNDAGSEPVGILKPADMTYETSYRRRTSLRDSQQSTNVEVGGTRVQFAGKHREDLHPSERSNHNGHEQYPRYESRRYIDEPASPPLDRMERLHIRHSSPSPQRAYDDVRADRARRISPLPATRYQQVHYRHVSTSPGGIQERRPRPPPSPIPVERSSHSGYRHVSRTRIAERTHSLTPPPSRKQLSPEADETDSEDEEHGRLIEVRSWKGIDENGQPATFVEERRKTRMIDQGSVGGSEFRPLTERLSARSWHEV